MDINIFIGSFISRLTTAGLKLLIGILVLYFGFKIINKVIKSFSSILDKKGFDPTLHSFLHAFSEIILKLILILVVFGYVGIDTTGLAAVLTSAGLALGLALQGSLANFAGGVVLLFMRPFKVNDFVEVGEYSGKVEKIRIFYTNLLTADNKQILIPNGKIADSSIINYSARKTRRIDLTFGVDYDSDVANVKNILWNVIKEEPLILKTPKPFVNIIQHGDSSVNYTVRVWTKTPNYWTVYFNLMEKVKIRFDEEKINIPYPQMEVRLKNEKMDSN
ncbi:MAG: mechanosensitive ion channel [Clostridiaceae bacterium]|nr:mechanosensitive ion channel [Clostridiaceae bacterium]